MLVSVVAKYAAGGYPGPTYRGEHGFTMNVRSAANDAEVMDAAKDAARERIADSYQMSRSLVVIETIAVSRSGVWP